MSQQRPRWSWCELGQGHGALPQATFGRGGAESKVVGGGEEIVIVVRNGETAAFRKRESRGSLVSYQATQGV